LAASFLEAHLEREGMESGAVRITPGAMKAMQAHDWPGNVRELRNLVEGAAVFAREGDITRADVNAKLGIEGVGNGEVGEGLSFREAKASFERAYFQALIKRNRGNISAAAREAGLERGYIHRLLKKLMIDAGAFRES
jgi:DNA-binding NtrC family response regulator